MCYGYAKKYSDLRNALCNYKVIGISKDENDYYGQMVKDVYWNIGTVHSSYIGDVTNVYKYETSTRSSVSGRVGLMNVSDYFYAGTENSNTTVQNNWLYVLGNEWTMSPYSGNLSDPASFYISNNGSSGGAGNYYGYAIRPVVYLDSSVYIISGDGTEANPYQIGM